MRKATVTERMLVMAKWLKDNPDMPSYNTIKENCKGNVGYYLNRLIKKGHLQKTEWRFNGNKVAYQLTASGRKWLETAKVGEAY